MQAEILLPILIQISTMLIIFSVGLQGRWGDLVHVIKRPSLLLRGFIAVYVAVPLAAFAVATLLPIEPAVKIGIVAMALAPLAPLAPGKMIEAGAGTSYVVGMYAALLMLAALVLPASLTLMNSFTGGSASIRAWPIASIVATTVLLPLVLGITVGGIAPAIARRFAPGINIVAILTLGILVALILVKVHGQILALIGNGTLLAIVIAELIGLACGHMLGGPDPAQRMALAHAAASRHPGLAVLMIQENFRIDPAMLAAVLLYLILGAVLSALYLRWARKRLIDAGSGSQEASVR